MENSQPARRGRPPLQDGQDASGTPLTKQQRMRRAQRAYRARKQESQESARVRAEELSNALDDALSTYCTLHQRIIVGLQSGDSPAVLSHLNDAVTRMVAIASSTNKVMDLPPFMEDFNSNSHQETSSSAISQELNEMTRDSPTSLATRDSHDGRRSDLYSTSPDQSFAGTAIAIRTTTASPATISARISRACFERVVSIFSSPTQYNRKAPTLTIPIQLIGEEALVTDSLHALSVFQGSVTDYQYPFQSAARQPRLYRVLEGGTRTLQREPAPYVQQIAKGRTRTIIDTPFVPLQGEWLEAADVEEYLEERGICLRNAILSSGTLMAGSERQTSAQEVEKHHPTVITLPGPLEGNEAYPIDRRPTLLESMTELKNLSQLPAEFISADFHGHEPTDYSVFGLPERKRLLTHTNVAVQTPTEAWLHAIEEPDVLRSDFGQQIARVAPSVFQIIVNMDKLVHLLAESAVCIGPVPGIRKEDVDASIRDSIVLEHSLIAAKQAERAARIPEEWRLPTATLADLSETSEVSAFSLLETHQWLNEDERRLTENFTAQELCLEISSGKVTALEVCRAFCHRAAIAQQLINCATEIMFEEALLRAQELDNYFAKEGKVVGPLHGLPISVKDTFNIKGQATTVGLVSFLKNPVAAENSPLIDILLEKGAVLYIKTNIPQTLMTLDSINNVFGRTLNPHRLSLTAGGSSGGEGALVSFRGSILGIGTDIGGSIRVPSLCNGTYGFKPTSNRIPYGGQLEPMRPGTPGILPSAGPLSQSASDLTFLVREVLLTRPWLKDSTALGVAWRDVPRKASLNIGLFLGDEHYPLAPAARRALQSAAEKLAQKGHTVTMVDNFPSVHEAVKIAARLFLLDNDHTVMGHLNVGEEKPIAALSYTNLANVVGSRPSTLDDVWTSNNNLASYRERLLEFWKRLDLDVLLCPGARTSAAPHDTFGMPAYTLIWNLLDFPASIIPYSGFEQKPVSSEEPTSGSHDSWNHPNALQIVGWRFQDEEVLQATEIIDSALRT
ncbi:amidase signature domain-containing protein [Paramyrothecium foliicola]|nr:amidase signature domain-containing protein [Paramyrothecium foliicola]